MVSSRRGNGTRLEANKRSKTTRSSIIVKTCDIKRAELDFNLFRQECYLKLRATHFPTGSALGRRYLAGMKTNIRDDWRDSFCEWDLLFRLSKGIAVIKIPRVDAFDVHCKFEVQTSRKNVLLILIASLFRIRLYRELEIGNVWKEAYNSICCFQLSLPLEKTIRASFQPQNWEKYLFEMNEELLYFKHFSRSYVACSRTVRLEPKWVSYPRLRVCEAQTKSCFSLYVNSATSILKIYVLLSISFDTNYFSL